MKWARMLQWSSLAALAVAFVFSFNLTRTHERLADVTSRLRTDVRSGGWEHDVTWLSSCLASTRRDELGLLSNAFGHMIEEVHRTHEARNMLDRRVAERTNELQASNDELVVARDKAEAAKRATDAFVASVSHELRTPLNHIIGFCQLMELTDLDDQQRDDLGKIRGAGQYLLDLINDILDYQKNIMGGLRLETEDIALAPLVDEISDAMRMKAAENGNEVVVDCGRNLALIRTDPKRLRQILCNLIGNACKFTRKGTITVSARRHDESADGRDRVELSIRDTGVAMTPEQQAKLFQPFAKLSEKQWNKDGSGLGLVVSRGFCERMGAASRSRARRGRGPRSTSASPPSSKPSRRSASRDCSVRRRPGGRLPQREAFLLARMRDDLPGPLEEAIAQSEMLLRDARELDRPAACLGDDARMSAAARARRPTISRTIPACASPADRPWRPVVGQRTKGPSPASATTRGSCGPTRTSSSASSRRS